MAESLRSRRADMLKSRLQGGVLTSEGVSLSVLKCLLKKRCEVGVALFEEGELGVFVLFVCL